MIRHTRVRKTMTTMIMMLVTTIMKITIGTGYDQRRITTITSLKLPTPF